MSLIQDPSTGTAASVKAASTAAAATDQPVVVALHPTSPLPAGTNALGSVSVTGTTTVAGTVTANQGTAAALAGAWPVEVTDGTHTLPTMDAVARAAFVKLTDGTNTAAVKAASTAAVATDPAEVVSLSPNSPLPAGTNAIGTVAQGTAAALAAPWPVEVTDGTHTLPTMDAVARAAFVKLTDGTNTAAVKAASTAAVATDPAEVVSLSPNSPLPAGTNAIGTVTVSPGAQSVARKISANSTNQTNVKASSTQLTGWSIQNTTANILYVKVYNKATAPVVGTDTPFITLAIPGGGAGAGNNVAGLNLTLGTGFGYGTTTNPADSDATAVPLNALIINFFYV